eukprot:61075-Pelagomonas_calceolata.AAC.3
MSCRLTCLRGAVQQRALMSCRATVPQGSSAAEGTDELQGKRALGEQCSRGHRWVAGRQCLRGTEHQRALMGCRAKEPQGSSAAEGTDGSKGNSALSQDTRLRA